MLQKLTSGSVASQTWLAFNSVSETISQNKCSVTTPSYFQMDIIDGTRWNSFCFLLNVFDYVILSVPYVAKFSAKKFFECVKCVASEQLVCFYFAAH